MNITYRRVNQTGYMILESEDSRDITGYEKEMLKNNDIPNLLPFYSMAEDGRRLYWYEITGYRTLRDLMQREHPTAEGFASLFAGIDTAYRRLAPYLIAEENIILSPDTVFLGHEEGTREVYLSYYPGRNKTMQEGISELFEFFMEYTSAMDETLSDLLFEWYEMSLSPDFSLRRICDQAAAAARKPAGGEGALPGNTPSFQSASSCSSHETFAGVEGIPSGNDPSFQSVSSRSSRETFAGGEGALPDSRREAASDPGEAEWEDYCEGSGEPDPERKPGLFSRFLSLFRGKNSDSEVGTDRTSAPSKNRQRRWPLSGRRREHMGDDSPRDLEEEYEYRDEGEEEVARETVLLTEDRDRIYGRLIYEGEQDEDDFELEGEELRIGSLREGNDARLNSPTVSRHHARIFRVKDRFFIEDLNSSNGTYVNNEPLNYREQVELHYMDRIRFADVSYRIY